MTVTAKAQIVDIVVVGSGVADRRGPLQKAVLVVELVPALAIAVVDEGALQLEAQHREVLVVEVRCEDVIGADVVVVQTGVGVFLQTPKVGQVVLQAVVGEVSEEADARLVVLK